MKNQARILLLSVAIIAMAGCASLRSAHKTQQKLFPQIVKDLHFGMNTAEFLKARPTAEKYNDEGFRTVYLEEFSDGDVSSIAYYVSETDILYEFILNYRTEARRDEVASSLLGNPNFEEKEWMIDSNEGFRINVWKHENKLVYAGKIATTEWEEGKN